MRINKTIAIAAKSATPAIAPPTIALIGRGFEEALPLTDPVDDPPRAYVEDTLREEVLADAPVAVAGFTSGTPILSQTDCAFALAAAMSALEHVASMQDAMLSTKGKLMHRQARSFKVQPPRLAVPRQLS